MKKIGLLFLILSVVVLTGCSNGKKTEEKTAETESIGMKIEPKKKKRNDVINNFLVGNSKISFNNVNYNMMSDGQFTQTELWGTFESENNQNSYIQIDAFNNEQAIYGDIYTYELEGITWADAEPVQYSNFMEEAIQYSQDGKSLMYKARTGDVLFSVAMFGKKKLTEEEVLELKALAKGIKIDYVENQITSEE